MLRRKNSSKNINMKIPELTRNTQVRNKAYLFSGRHFAGQGGAIEKFADEACSFKLEGKYQKGGEPYVPNK